MIRRTIAFVVCALLFGGSISAQELLLREDGQIAASEVRLEGGGEVVWYSIEASEPGMLSIHLISVDFSPRLLIEVDNTVIDTVEDSYGTIVHSLPAAPGQPMRIGVGASNSSESGSYSLRVESGAPARTLTPDTPTTGRLTTDASGESVPLLFTYNGTAGQMIRIRQESMEFDTYLTISDSSGEIASNDDVDGTTTDSEVVHFFSEDGTIFIQADSYGSYGEGRFTITAFPVEVDTSFTPGMEIAAGDEVTGMLTPADPQIGGRRAKEYSIEVEEGSEIDLLLRSDDFDALLIAESPSGRRYTDDDSGGNLNSHLVLIADEPGRWRVYAGALGMQATGTFTLRYRAGTPKTVVQEFDGSLSDHGRVVEQRLFQEHQLQTEPGAAYRIALSSDDFDTYLLVMDANGTVVAENDDFGGSTDSQVDLDADGGEYTILVGAYYGSPTGNYRVQVMR